MLSPYTNVRDRDQPIDMCMHEPKRLVQTNHSVQADTPGYMRTYVLVYSSSSLDQPSRSTAYSFVFMLGPKLLSERGRRIAWSPLFRPVVIGRQRQRTRSPCSPLVVVRASSLVWSVGSLMPIILVCDPIQSNPIQSAS